MEVYIKCKILEIVIGDGRQTRKAPGALHPAVVQPPFPTLISWSTTCSCLWEEEHDEIF